jgi:hypothetical protein
MRVIINERQLRTIIENESNERLLEVSVDEFLSAENVIIRQYKKRGYEGIKLIGDVYFENKQDKYFERLFEHVIEIEGYLDLISSKIKSLGNLEYVGGNLYLGYCRELKSFGKLKYIGKNLYLSSSPLSKLSDKEIRSQVEIKGKIIRD